VIVVGVGNPWRGDDAAGLAVARRLDGLALEGDATALLDIFKVTDRVIVVDACAGGGKPGDIRRFDARAAPLPVTLLRSSTHAFGVSDAVELARTLGRLPRSLDVYAIEGEDFSLGRGLSPAVASAVEALAAAIAARGTTITGQDAWRISDPLTPPTITERKAP
jgi:hydrogenase maturation protease